MPANAKGPVKPVLMTQDVGDKKKQPPYTSTPESNTLSNKGSFTARDMVKREILDKVVIADLNLC